MATPISLTREQLYEKVWSTPLRTVAKEYGLSDVGLKKICTRHDIPTPGLGYGAKVALSRPVSRTPLAPAQTRSRKPLPVLRAGGWRPAT
jgi:hypothetical protein